MNSQQLPQGQGQGHPQAQQRPQNPTAMVNQYVAQLQQELQSANEKGRDTPEGLQHIQRAQHLRQQLLRYQEFVRSSRLANAQNGAGGAQPGQPGAQPGAQAARGVPGQQAVRQGQQAVGGIPNRASGTPNPQLLTPQQQAQLHARQVAAGQQQHAGQRQQQPAGPGGMPPMPQSLQQQQFRAQQAVPTAMAGIQNQSGLQQRYLNIEELRRGQQQLRVKMERTEAAIPQLTSPAEAQRAQHFLQQARARIEQYRVREEQLLQEVRAALATQNQAAAAQGGARQMMPGHTGLASTPAVPGAQRPDSSAGTRAPVGGVAGQQQHWNAQQGTGMPPPPASLVRASQGPPPARAPVAAGAVPGQTPAALANGGPGPIPSGPTAPGQQANLQRAQAAAAGAGANNSATPQAQNQASQRAQQATASRPSTQSMPIPAHINVPPPQPVNARPNRPTLTNGGATGAPGLSTPAMTRVPNLDLSGDRVLSKRKLQEMVAAVLGEDHEALIDGDVEELLLDLADEFVTSVTGFACRVAKHRKSDSLDAKDIHLHLERNWNMHIPGYSSDEIRSIRRLVPTATYQTKLQGINNSKSVFQTKP